MFINIFPKGLLGLCHQIYPHRRLQAIMLPIIPIGEYQRHDEHLEAEQRILSNNELEQVHGFTLARRQEEWLTTRVCAKISAMRYHVATRAPFRLSPNTITVSNNESGRPSLAGQLSPELSNADLSLSHGAGYGLALLADTRCGVDIEEPREALLRTQDRYCTEEEAELLLQALGEVSLTQQLALLWAAKEAGKKSLSHLRMPGFSELILTGLTPHSGGWELHFIVSTRHFQAYPPTITLAAEIYDGFTIAICLTGEAIDA